MTCPECSGPMTLWRGCGWDYDTWVCNDRHCPGKIELSETTYYDNEE